MADARVVDQDVELLDLRQGRGDGIALVTSRWMALPIPWMRPAARLRPG